MVCEALPLHGLVAMSNKEMVSTETENKGQRKVFVPNKLFECLPRLSSLPNERLRWNTNEEIASYLISFDRHDEWLSCSLKTRPKNGSIILYNRKKVKYRKDGYCWKKRKDGKTTREDHMKLKVQGTECLYGCYVHSSIVPTFHRRCYWLLQNPDIVLVHYLNVPSQEDSGKCSPLLCAVNERHDSLRWSREELLSQLKPMFHSMKCSLGSGDFSIEDLVQHILERQRTKPQPRTHTCLCTAAHVSAGGNIPHRCNSTKHRIISPKLPPSSCTSSPLRGERDAKLSHLSSPASSPSPSTTSSSPPQPHRATLAVGNHSNGFYGDRRGNLATVALPQNAVIVMATTAIPPPAASPSPPCSSPTLPTLSLTLLPSPVIGGLLLTPPQPPSPPAPPPSLPPAFDPDSFLNSPKQGETYGGPPPSSSPPVPPLSPPSLALSLSPTSTPPSSVSPPSSLSSLSSSSSSSSPPSSSVPPTLSLSPTASPPLPPLCLELGAQGEAVGRQAEEGGDKEEEGGDDDDEDDEGRAPPTKLALLQTSHTPSCPSPRQHTGSSAASEWANQMQQDPQLYNHLSETPPPVAVAMDTAPVASPPVQVKEERRRGLEEAHMEEEAEPEPRGGDGGHELDISFDSSFPDLISDLITEEAPPPVVTPTPPLFPAGVRYMVPPQPSPSSSFLPFPHPLPSSNRLASITDFSPEWSYPEGGVKVLITGPWSEPSGRYSCVFDQSNVPATLIQPGVLRCYCPAHEAGLVCLQVLESGGSLSSSVLFEYRARNASSLPSSQLDWLSLDDNQFRMSILERLEQMERRMAEMAARDNHQQQQQHYHHKHHHGNQLATPPAIPLPEDQEQSSQWFERRIVGVCERMKRGGRWCGGRGGGERLHHSPRHRGMTLLHLAAAQGYTHLIHTLIHWRSVNPDSLDLEQEVDPLNIDHFSCTPLMWACALGHQRAAELLYGWNSSALGIPDSLGRLPLAVARSRGHTRLATALEDLHTHTLPRDIHTPPEDTPQPPSPLSTSPDTGLSSSSSLPSPSPSPSSPSPSPSSAYSSGPAPMDTSPSPPSSPSSSSSSLPISPSSLPPLPESMWGEDPDSGAGLNPGGSRASPLFLMDYSENTETEEEEEEELLEEEVLQVDMATLAEQIIEATPERIKQEDFPRGAESPLRERRDNPDIQDTWLATYLDSVDAHPHSPPRRLCPPSPLSVVALQRLRPPSSAAWAEFLNASANGKIERDFALLTLTDGEQRELYEAARIIQNAFRRYKGRRLKEQQDMAAAVIQRCYRKYKQYALYKKMTQAAILIQSKFRSYYEQKRFQQSRRAAVLIQQYYRSYKEYERLKQGPRGAAGAHPKIKGSFLTKKQDQAARKIMRFLRRCRHRIKELKQSRELERRGLTT
ncbi:calmodulin-binding transcription activator 2 isoform X2 [Eleginops maclovinus]|uniref:calmodulin-binding transcription activator 2 isoform X2 n=1 Tax=Eleginops maclovinus TaxID=56733 RepID=UPI003080AE13